MNFFESLKFIIKAVWFGLTVLGAAVVALLALQAVGAI